MAVTTDKPVYGAYLEQNKEIDYGAGTFKLALMTGTFVFDPDKHKAWDAAEWAPDTVYSEGDTVKPGGSADPDIIYRCTVGGTSGAASEEPVWPDPAESAYTWGDTFTDNGVTWEIWSYLTIADEIVREDGYSTGPVTLANQTVTEDEANNLSEFACDDVQIDSESGSFGPTGAAIIFDDTHAQKPLCANIDFGNDYTPTGGTPIKITNIRIQAVAKQGVSG